MNHLSTLREHSKSHPNSDDSFNDSAIGPDTDRQFSNASSSTISSTGYAPIAMPSHLPLQLPSAREWQDSTGRGQTLSSFSAAFGTPGIASVARMPLTKFSAAYDMLITIRARRMAIIPEIGASSRSSKSSGPVSAKAPSNLGDVTQRRSVISNGMGYDEREPVLVNDLRLQNPTHGDAIRRYQINGKLSKSSRDYSSHIEDHNYKQKSPSPSTRTAGSHVAVKETQRAADLDHRDASVDLRRRINRCIVCGKGYAQEIDLKSPASSVGVLHLNLSF